MSESLKDIGLTISRIIRRAAKEGPDDIGAAAREAECEIRDIPDFEELIQPILVSRAISRMIHHRRSKMNRNLHAHIRDRDKAVAESALIEKSILDDSPSPGPATAPKNPTPPPDRKVKIWDSKGVDDVYRSPCWDKNVAGKRLITLSGADIIKTAADAKSKAFGTIFDHFLCDLLEKEGVKSHHRNAKEAKITDKRLDEIWAAADLRRRRTFA